MSLGKAFSRLSLRPSTLCKECRRTFVSTRFRQANQSQSATKLFSELMQSPRTQTAASKPGQYGSQPAPDSLANAPATTESPANASRPRTSWDLGESAIREAGARTNQRRQQEKAAEELRGVARQDLERQVTRKFKVGDVYAPHDLTGVEMAKWKKLRRKGRQKWDVVDQLGINPVDHYKNFSMMSEHMSEMGRIKHSRETGLRPRNQRRMAKAIRRAIGIGLMPGVHRHPEILRLEMNPRHGMNY